MVRVDDADEGPSGRVASLQIVDGDEDGYFRVQRVTGVDNEFTIAVLRLLDRERSPHGASARFFLLFSCSFSFRSAHWARFIR